MTIHKTYQPKDPSLGFFLAELEIISDDAEDIQESDESIPLMHITYKDNTETDTDIFWLRDHYPTLEDINALAKVEIRILNKQEFETLFS